MQCPEGIVTHENWGIVGISMTFLPNNFTKSTHAPLPPKPIVNLNRTSLGTIFYGDKLIFGTPVLSKITALSLPLGGTVPSL